MQNPFKTPLIISPSVNEGVGLLLKEVGEQVIAEFDQTPQMKEHAEFIRHAVNEYNGLRVDLTMTTIAMHDAVDREKKALRMHEIIADLSFSLGHAWRVLMSCDCQKIMDHVQGSRGLMQLMVQWVEEFDGHWEALPEEQQEDYIEDVDTFFTKKFDELKVEAFKS